MKKENKKISCAICGSKDINISHNDDTVQAVYGSVVPYREKVITCNTCKSNYSDGEITENAYSLALEKSKKESVANILDNLPQLGYNLAAMERALELPQRTLSRWKSGKDLSAAGLALLRIINTYPWIIEVADAKYNARFSVKILCDQAYNVYDKMFNYIGYDLSARGGMLNEDSIIIYRQYQNRKEEIIEGSSLLTTSSANSYNKGLHLEGVTNK